MDLHELCEAYRKGHRWYMFDGSKEETAHTRAAVFAEFGRKPVPDVDHGNCWRLYRQIAFSVTGSDPIQETSGLDYYSDLLSECTVADFLLIAKCIKRVLR